MGGAGVDLKEGEGVGIVVRKGERRRESFLERRRGITKDFLDIEVYYGRRGEVQRFHCEYEISVDCSTVDCAGAIVGGSGERFRLLRL